MWYSQIYDTCLCWSFLLFVR